MYYVSCVHGFIRDIKSVQPTKKIFECTPDVRSAKPFNSVAEVKAFMIDECNYMGHYAILTPADIGEKDV
jgi:hypothetical protein